MVWPVRIAVVTTSYPRFEGDPSGHFVAAEVAAMAQRGDDVTVVTPSASAAFGWPGVAARLRANPARIGSAARWVIAARRELAAMTRAAPIDRVVAHWAVPCAMPIATGGDRDGRGRWALEVVSHGGDVRVLARLPGPVRAAIVRRIATRADRWRFVSEPLLEALVTALPADAARALARVARIEACMLHMPDVRDAIARRRAELGGAAIAVCVGRLVASKRVDAAIAYAAAHGRTLVVVGDGPERARLEEVARGVARHGARVRFVGRTTREEALAWIGAASEVLHASRIEGLSTVLRVAAALNVPVTLVPCGPTRPRSASRARCRRR
jgi:glycosyltransferase involved in cell wall biosynthesis